MTNSQSILFDLICIRITGKTSSLSSSKDGQSINWSKIIRLALNQGVLVIVYDAFELIPAEQRLNNQLLIMYKLLLQRMVNRGKQGLESVCFLL